MKVNSISIDYKGATLRILDFFSNETNGPSDSVRHTHKTWELHFAKGGEYYYEFDGEKIKLSSYQMLIIPPNTPHKTVLVDTNYKFFALALDLIKPEEQNEMNSFFYDILKDNSLKAIDITPSFLKRCEILKQNQLHETIQGICKVQAEGAAFIYDLFSLLGAFKLPHVKNRVSSQDDIPLLLSELVNVHNITLKDIAEVIGYSTRHTARLIKKYNLSRTKSDE